MKVKEYFYLAKLSISEHKKSSASTIKGLAVGFIILLPLLSMLIGINFSVNKQLNEIPYVLYFETSMSDFRTETENFYNTETNIYNLSGSNLDNILDNSFLSNKIIYEKHILNSAFADENNIAEYCIGTNEYIPIIGKTLPYNYYSIIDIDKSDSFFPKNLIKNYPEGIFIKNCDQGFTNNGKQQVIVSEKFLNLLNLKAESVYNKTLSIRVTNNINFKDNVTNIVSGYICKNYKVVGIIKSEVTELYNFKNSYNMYSYMYSDLFFSSVNVYENEEAILKPKVLENQNNKIILEYENFEDKERLNEEYMMLGWSISTQNELSKNSSTLFNTNIYAESNNYKEINKAEKMLNNYFYNLFKKDINALSFSPAYLKYEKINKEVNLVSYILSFVGLIIAFCAVINLYLSIKHNVTQRKTYLTMLRAVGAKQSFIPKLYYSESLIIVTRANIFIAVIGFAISSAVKIIIDSTLKMQNTSYNLSIPWSIIIICVFSLIVFLYLLGSLFAIMCTFRLSKKPIIKILNNTN